MLGVGREVLDETMRGQSVMVDMEVDSPRTKERKRRARLRVQEADSIPLLQNGTAAAAGGGESRAYAVGGSILLVVVGGSRRLVVVVVVVISKERARIAPTSEVCARRLNVAAEAGEALW